jgi:hypothetical protein
VSELADRLRCSASSQVFLCGFIIQKLGNRALDSVTDAAMSAVLVLTTAALVLMLLYHVLLHLRATVVKVLRDAQVAAWLLKKEASLAPPAAADTPAGTAADADIAGAPEAETRCVLRSKQARREGEVEMSSL